MNAKYLSIGQPASLKFFPLAILQKKRLINDQIGSQNIVVYFDPIDWTFSAFGRGKRTFDLRGDKMVDQSGKKWLTKAWKRFYPKGSIYSSK